MKIEMVFFVNEAGIWGVYKKGKAKLGGGRGHSMAEALADYANRYPDEVRQGKKGIK
ncbi:MAG: hypothetical protein LBQ47_07655 [Endomicrobium sp.]|jgi:hypothetical protein|nr:hypothetical protein [Endomicrobium sp.]